MRKNTEGAVQSLASEKQLQRPEDQEKSENLPQSVSMQLLSLMKEVVREDVNPSTVNSACKCASEIHKMIKLNLEMKRSGY
jgi:hypothetical protein